MCCGCFVGIFFSRRLWVKVGNRTDQFFGMSSNLRTLCLRFLLRFDICLQRMRFKGKPRQSSITGSVDGNEIYIKKIKQQTATPCQQFFNRLLKYDVKDRRSKAMCCSDNVCNIMKMPGIRLRHVTIFQPLGVFIGKERTSITCTKELSL